MAPGRPTAVPLEGRRFYALDDLATELPEGMDLPEGAVEIERLPETGERIDPKTGAITLDTALLAEMTEDPAQVARMHTIKAAEAALVMSGYSLTRGVLAEEAAALGLGIEALAEDVLAASAAERDAEVARRVLKTGINTEMAKAP